MAPAQLVEAEQIQKTLRIEVELRAVRDGLEFLFASSPIVIYTCKPYGDYAATFVGQNVTSQLGYAPEEFTKDSKFWVNHLHPEDRQRVLDSLSSLINKGHHFTEYRLQHKDGTYRRIKDEMKLIRDGSGNPLEVIGYRIDDTRRELMDGGRRKYGLSVWKRAEHLEDAVEYRTRQLIESEARYRTLFENIPERIFTKDRKSSYVSCNDHIARDLNISPDQICGKTDYDFYPRELADSYRAVDKRVMSSGKAEEIEEKYVACGHEFIVDTIRTPLRDSGGNVSGVLGIFRDITERKKMEARLAAEEMKQRLLKAELEATEQLAGMVGHDLRNPLQAIVGAVGVLKRDLVIRRDEKAKKMIHLIENSVEYADKIVYDLLDYSRELQLELTNTNVKSLLKDTFALLKIPDNINVADLTPNELVINIDPARIKRVFLNLIRNAIDAMPNGGKLTISSQKLDEKVTIGFVDTGIGMTKEVLGRLWTPLFTTKAKGVGLGLPICKRMVEAHGGQITVASTLGEGTTFTITLPLKTTN